MLIRRRQELNQLPFRFSSIMDKNQDPTPCTYPAGMLSAFDETTPLEDEKKLMDMDRLYELAKNFEDTSSSSNNSDIPAEKLRELAQTDVTKPAEADSLSSMSSTAEEEKQKRRSAVVAGKRPKKSTRKMGKGKRKAAKSSPLAESSTSTEHDHPNEDDSSSERDESCHDNDTPESNESIAPEQHPKPSNTKARRDIGRDKSNQDDNRQQPGTIGIARRVTNVSDIGRRRRTTIDRSRQEASKSGTDHKQSTVTEKEVKRRRSMRLDTSRNADNERAEEKIVRRSARVAMTDTMSGKVGKKKI